MPNGLRAYGLAIETHKDHFNSDESDPVWIKEVGKRGWAILTKDKHIKSRPLELSALLASGQPTFVVASANATAEDNIKTIVAALRDIAGCIRTIPAPFVAQITGGGKLSVLMTQTTLMELSRRPKPT